MIPLVELHSDEINMDVDKDLPKRVTAAIGRYINTHSYRYMDVYLPIYISQVYKNRGFNMERNSHCSFQ